MKTKNDFMNRGAILCSHIADEGLPILVAFRDEIVDPADSGWQFLCYSGKDETDARFCSLGDVLKLEPSLEKYLNLPVGSRLARENKSSEWKELKDDS